MRSFKEIIVELKIFLADGKKVKILDKDIALLLKINQARFATLKKRDVTPYAELILFCKINSFSSDRLFFKT
jgi:hypothetical protein